MTTEQMDWLDDERAGRHRWPFTPNPDDSVKPDPMGDASLAHRLRAMGAVQTRFMQRDPEHNEPMEWVNAPLEVVVEQAKRAASVFSEDLHDWAEEHTHHTREARDQCAAGDHQYAKLLDDVAEREKLKADAIHRLAEGLDVPEDLITGQTTMAEEPIERRLQRAFLNGYKEGVDRAAFATQEATGKWDY